MISTRIVCRPFIGRAGELEHLLLRRRQAGDGHGGLVLIGGEPGIGKSRVVRELKERLNRHTATFASSACREFAQKPLGPILEILEQIAKVRSAELAGSTKNERYDLIAETFARVAAKRTTVAVLEDLHWADIDLVQILLLLVRRAANARLLFVATYRDNELTPEHPLFRWFGRLVREPEVSVVTLSRFTDRELDRLMARALDGTTTLRPAIMHAVRERADGNPLFAEELLRNAVDSQRGGLSVRRRHSRSRCTPSCRNVCMSARTTSALSYAEHRSSGEISPSPSSAKSSAVPSRPPSPYWLGSPRCSFSTPSTRPAAAIAFDTR